MKHGDNEVNLGLIARRYLEAMLELRQIREENDRLSKRIAEMVQAAEKEAAEAIRTHLDLTA